MTTAYQPLPGKASPVSSSNLQHINVLAACRSFLSTEMKPQDRTRTSSIVPDTDVTRALRRNTAQFNAPADASVEAVPPVVLAFWRPLQAGSVRTCVLTLVATALGSGALALPYAFSHVGYVVGTIVLTVAASLSCLSLTVIMMASRYTEAETFASLLTLATGSPRAGLLLDVCLMIYGCAAILALLIFEGDFVPAIMAAAGLPAIGRTYAILGVAAGTWPLVLPSEVSSLRYVAALSPFAVLFVAANVALQTPSYYAANIPSTVEAMTTKPGEMLQASSIFVFSVFCHLNAVGVASKLERPSVGRIVNVAAYTSAFCWALYLFIGLGGYLSFQALVKGDFLQNYETSNKSMLACRVMFSLVCYVGIPVNCAPTVHAVRQVVLSAFQGNADNSADRPLLHAVLATVVLAAATVGAINLTNVAAVIGIVGGSLTTLQMFWMPALIYYRILYPMQPRLFRRGVMSLLLTGGVVGFASVFTAVL